MAAIRLHDVLDSEELDISSDHVDHMYSGNFSWYYYRRFDMVLDRANVEDVDSVLVLGGGSGAFTLSLLDRVDTIYFVEMRSGRFNDANTLFNHAGYDSSGVRFINGDGSQLPLQSQTVDAAFALDTLEHIPESDKAISEVARVLKPGGQIVSSIPIEVGPPLLIRELYRLVDGQRHQSGSVGELLKRVVGQSPVRDPYGHRGYDYRDTVSDFKVYFSDLSVEFCPFPALKWLNPTAIITAQS